MSDDLFSFTNCGEPKQVVEEFIDEVVKTLQWVTEEVRERTQAPPPPDVTREMVEESVECHNDELEFDKELESKVEEEKHKILSHMISWATLGILGGESKEEVENEQLQKGEVKEEERTAKLVSQAPTEALVSELEHVTSEEYARNLVLREKIKTFLKRARSAYGRTALCLSGGAMMGNYHFGAVKALLET